MKTLVCIDRDGTLIYDSPEHLFIGHTDAWREQVRLLPGVAEGIRLLNRLPETRLYMITNQSGVAIKELSLLTEQRAREVCQYVIDVLGAHHALLDGFFVCPHVPPEYAAQHPQYELDEHLVCTCDCIKPRLGMVFSALKKEGVDLTGVSVYVIGDRASDVETGINAGGVGILVPGEPGEEEKVRRLPHKYFIEKDFLSAAQRVVQQAQGKNASGQI